MGFADFVIRYGERNQPLPEYLFIDLPVQRPLVRPDCQPEVS